MEKFYFISRFRFWSAFLLIAVFFSCKRPETINGGRITNDSAGKDKENETVFLEIPQHPLETKKDLDILLQEIGDARIVLLGEATHGTSEYYRWRTAISQRLIEEKGFDFIAVEGEWADSYRVDQFIKGPVKDSIAVAGLLQYFNRWPSWMWANHEVAELVQWLNHYNQQKAEGEKAGFFGLDVYCLWESMEELIPYLPPTEKKALRAARRVERCFEPFTADGQEYAMAVADSSANCRIAVKNLWKRIQKLTSKGKNKSKADFLLEQNALVALNGERYYSAMVKSSTEAWNIRDNHMMETLIRLLEFHGPDSKAIIWEHNTHVGDARYTDMAASGEVNVGQLARQKFGEDQVYIVGFGSNEGSVIAARAWGAPYEIMQLPAAPEGTWENILHRLNPYDKIIFSKDIQHQEFLQKPIGHRAVGVVYHAHLEKLGNYVPSIMPKRYDAFLYIDKTTALHPLNMPVVNEPPDLYPWGL